MKSIFFLLQVRVNLVSIIPQSLKVLCIFYCRNNSTNASHKNSIGLVRNIIDTILMFDKLASLVKILYKFFSSG